MASNSLNSGFGVRRLGSPSSKSGPMKATVQFTLVQGSPTRGINGKKSSPASSPVPLVSSGKSRKSPDSRLSPEDASAGFKVDIVSGGGTVFRLSRGRLEAPMPVLYRRSGSLDRHPVERPKPIRPAAGSAGIKRTSSLDTIAVPYLTGQWPRGDYQIQHPSGPDYLDKTTQTPDEWEDLLEEKRRRKAGSHKRSSSVGNNGANDNLKEMIKARLAKTKEKTSNTQRTSPVQASHLPFGSSFIPSGGSFIQPGGSFIQTKAVAIPISHNAIKTFSPIRIRNSVEGLNQEIESALGNNKEFYRTQEPTPDGHRAPILELIQPGSSNNSGNHGNSHSNSNPSNSTTTAAITRTIDTQTPSQIIDSLSLNEETGLNSDSGSGSSRPPSTSPTMPIIPGGTQMDSSPRPSSRCADKMDDISGQDRTEIDGEEMETISPDHLTAMENLLEKCAPSPRPNKTFSFAREPPDGCEKVKIIDEPRRVPTLKEPLLYCPPLLKEGPPLIPSTVSAFCPLSKAYHHHNMASTELPINRSSSLGDIPKSPGYPGGGSADHQGNRSPSYSPSNNNYAAAISSLGSSNGCHGSSASPSNNNNNVRSSPLELP